MRHSSVQIRGGAPDYQNYLCSCNNVACDYCLIHATTPFEGTSVAVPILLSLAAEIGLKAWQCRERDGPPDQTHDLLNLFDALGENARTRLEQRMPEVPSPVAGLPPYYPGIRDALYQNKNLFVEWRYAHEHHSLFAETGVLKTALTAIVEAYFVEVPQGRVPER